VGRWDNTDSKNAKKAVSHLHLHLMATFSIFPVNLESLQRTLDVALERKEFKFFKQFLHHSLWSKSDIVTSADLPTIA
jgi:hypothetical protein